MSNQTKQYEFEVSAKVTVTTTDDSRMAVMIDGAPVFHSMIVADIVRYFDDFVYCADGRYLGYPPIAHLLDAVETVGLAAGEAMSS